MKELIAAAVGALALVVFGAAQSKSAAAASEAGTKAEILQIERERNRAIISGDADALDRMTSDDYTFITLRGELRTKAEIIQGFKSGSFHQKGRENGKDYSGDYRFTRVYARQGGRWQTVALQTTLIQP